MTLRRILGISAMLNASSLAQDLNLALAVSTSYNSNHYPTSTSYIDTRTHIYIYRERERGREREREMVDFGESDKMIRISGNMDGSDIYTELSGDISFFIEESLVWSSWIKNEISQLVNPF